LSDFEKVYEVKFDVRKAQAATKRLEKGLERVGKETKETGKKFEQYIAKASVRSMNRLNTRVKATQVNLARVRTTVNGISRNLAIASAAFAGFGAISVRNALELNKAMANVSTLLSGGIDQVRGLKVELQDMAKETGKSTGDLAEGLYEVVSALGENTQNVEQLDVATRAAVAGRASTIESVKLLSAVTKGYGDTSTEALEKVSDLAFQTVKLGQTTYPELAASMGRVVPLAAAMNTSQEELFGTMATLTGVTGNTAEVSTQLASIYSAILKPTEKMTDAAKKAGFESASQMVKTIGLRKSLIAMNDAVGGSEDKLAKLLKRKEALVAALALLGGQSDVYTEKLGEMQKASGATREAYQKQTEGINKQGFEWEKTKQRMIVFSQRLGDKLLPVLGRLLDKLEPVLELIEKMDEETMDSWIAFGKWIAIMAVATKALSVLLGVAEGLGTLRNLTTGLSNVSTGLAGVSAKADAAKASMLGFKVAGVASAAAVGVAIGSMLNDIFFAPGRARVARQSKEHSEKSFQARVNVARTGTLEEQKAELKRLETEKLPFETEFVSSAVSLLTGTESPQERRGRDIRERAAAKEALRRSIAEKTFAEDASIEQEYGIPTQVSRPRDMSSGQSIQTTNFININATGVSAEEVVRVSKREIKTAERRTLKELKTGQRGIAAAEH
jgi:TP901 family phage tail tape measure protein